MGNNNARNVNKLFYKTIMQTNYGCMTRESQPKLLFSYTMEIIVSYDLMKSECYGKRSGIQCFSAVFCLDGITRLSFQSLYTCTVLMGMGNR